MTEATITKPQLWADGFGNWHAIADAPITAGIAAAQRKAVKAARKAILDELAERERTTNETIGHARAVIRAYLKREPLRLDWVDAHDGWVTVACSEQLSTH